MKNAKILGLAVAAAMALTALLGTGSASATVLCAEYAVPCPQGKGLGKGTQIDLSLRAGTTLAVRDIGGNLIDTCTTSTMKGTTTNDGGATETIKGNVEALTLEKCTATFKALKLGTFEVHYKGPKTTGQLTSIGAEVTVVDFGVSCDYGSVGGVTLGILESDESESPDFFEEEATMPKEEGGFLCPGSIVVKGLYDITAPAKIYFKEKTA